jgi:BirA family biotin operon repressor/biotin-[acetyl-CoA-carboxylase] ligase
MSWAHDGPGRRSAGQASSGVGLFTNLWRLGRVDSTNARALEAAATGAPEGLVVVADEQTAGRGRLGRTWEAPPGACLLCSVLLRPSELVLGEIGFALGACAGLAAREAAALLAGVACDLKWPNDLLVRGRKLAGVLAEAAPTGGVVVGIGCNLATPWAGCWPAGATSLEEASNGRVVERDAFLEAFLVGFERRYELLCGDPLGGGRRKVLDEARSALCTLGALVRVELPSGRAIEGTATALRDDGRLVVALGEGDEAVIEAGDVVHLRHRSDAEATRGPSTARGQVP